MDGANQLFRSNPQAFLANNPVICYTGEAQQRNDVNRVNSTQALPVTQTFAPVVEFDLQRQPQGYYSLIMVGGTGSFASSSISRRLGYGSPIVANYIPYLGQKDKSPSSAHFGKINLSQVATNYVFTFTFTGCNFVVTQDGNGETWVYHEPTAAAWTVTLAARYPGENVVGTVGPQYDDNHISGFGCLVRTGARSWTALAQTSRMNGIGVDALDSLAINL